MRERGGLLGARGCAARWERLTMAMLLVGGRELENGNVGSDYGELGLLKLYLNEKSDI